MTEADQSNQRFPTEPAGSASILAFDKAFNWAATRAGLRRVRQPEDGYARAIEAAGIDVAEIGEEWPRVYTLESKAGKIVVVRFAGHITVIDQSGADSHLVRDPKNFIDTLIGALNRIEARTKLNRMRPDRSGGSSWRSGGGRVVR